MLLSSEKETSDFNAARSIQINKFVIRKNTPIRKKRDPAQKGGATPPPKSKQDLKFDSKQNKKILLRPSAILKDRNQEDD